jgi:hypothetical protein
MRYLLILPILAACAPGVPTRDDFTPSCGAESFVKFIGGSADVLQQIDLPRSSRILRPDAAITLDFSPDRLTIDVDELNRVSSVTCR